MVSRFVRDGYQNRRISAVLRRTCDSSPSTFEVPVLWTFADYSECRGATLTGDLSENGVVRKVPMSDTGDHERFLVSALSPSGYCASSNPLHPSHKLKHPFGKITWKNAPRFPPWCHNENPSKARCSLVWLNHFQTPTPRSARSYSKA